MGDRVVPLRGTLAGDAAGGDCPFVAAAREAVAAGAVRGLLIYAVPGCEPGRIPVNLEDWMARALVREAFEELCAPPAE